MIRFLFLLIIAAIGLALAFFRFKKVPMVKKMTVAVGAFVAAAVGLGLQSGFAWYMPILAIVGVSLAAAMLYKKLDEREELEKQRLAEERKERRQTQVETVSQKAEPERITASKPVAQNKISIVKETETPVNREALKETDSNSKLETLKEPKTMDVRETVPASGSMRSPEKIQERETIKVTEDEEVPEKPFGMQSIQPVGKER